jgi:uncharacterized OsmC-like protein
LETAPQETAEVRMNADELKALQAPVKKLYRDNPDRARLTLEATGTLDADRIVCVVNGFTGSVPAGLHPATGGDGKDACSGDMLLEALVGCAGVTLQAVATAMGITIRRGKIRAQGEMDFRGTLGVSRDVPVGFQTIRLYFDLDTDAPPDQLQTLVKLTERYCVVYQTLAKPPAIQVEMTKHA